MPRPFTIQRNRHQGKINFLVRQGSKTVARFPSLDEAESHVVEQVAGAAEAPAAEAPAKKAPAKKRAAKKAPAKRAAKK